jgi:hypothetical protein
LPQNSILPEDGSSKPVMVLRSVVFPAPLAPTKATISPSAMVKETPHKRLNPAVERMDVAHFQHGPVSQIHLDHIFAGGDFLWGSFGNLLTVVEHDDPIAQAHNGFHDVLDHDDGNPLIPNPDDQVHCLSYLGRV